MYGAGYLKFTFNNINLPDSNVNEPASNGFISYKVWQKANNPDGTVINNKASIYFDFNPPIVTNKTQHVINKLNRAGFITIIKNNQSLLDLRLFPNPFDQSATMVIGANILGNFDVNIYSLEGRLVYSKNYSNTNEATIYKDDLKSGMYIYRIESAGKILNTGKVVVK